MSWKKVRWIRAVLIGILCICLFPSRTVEAYYEAYIPDHVSAPDFADTEIWDQNPYERGTGAWLVWGMFYQTYGYLPVFGLTSSDLYATDVSTSEIVDALCDRDDNFTITDTPEAGAIGYDTQRQEAFFVKEAKQKDGTMQASAYFASEDAPYYQLDSLSEQQISSSRFAVAQSPVTTGTVEIIPVSALDGLSPDLYGSLNSISYELYSGDKKLQDVQAGEILELDPGEYHLKAKNVPDNYETDRKDAAFSIEKGDELTLRDVFVPKVWIEPLLAKKAPDPNASYIGVQLGGARFDVTWTQGGYSRIWHLVMDDEGKLILDEKHLDSSQNSDPIFAIDGRPVLPSGTLHITQTAGSPGYQMDGETKTVEIRNAEEKPVVYDENPVSLQVSVQTPGIDDRLPVEGQKFKLKVKDENRTITLTTDSAGQIHLIGIIAGHYELSMMDPQAGYEPPERRDWSFSVNDKGVFESKDIKDQQITVQETMHPYSLMIYQAANDENELTLCQDGEEIETKKISDGNVRFENLAPNTRYEIRQPSPWYSPLPAQSSFWLLENQKSAEFYVDKKVNTQSVIKGGIENRSVFLPADTLNKGDFPILFWIALMVLIIAAGAFAVWKYMQKKKQKQNTESESEMPEASE